MAFVGSNTRTDKYGGDFAGRFTFLSEVVKRVTKEWPAGKLCPIKSTITITQSDLGAQTRSNEV